MRAGTPCKMSTKKFPGLFNVGFRIAALRQGDDAVPVPKSRSGHVLLTPFFPGEKSRAKPLFALHPPNRIGRPRNPPLRRLIRGDQTLRVAGDDELLVRGDDQYPDSGAGSTDIRLLAPHLVLLLIDEKLKE